MNQPMSVHHTRPQNPIPQDPVLPELRVALEPGLMQAIFQDLLFAKTISADSPARYQVDDCIIERVKYKAREMCGELSAACC